MWIWLVQVLFTLVFPCLSLVNAHETVHWALLDLAYWPLLVFWATYLYHDLYTSNGPDDSTEDDDNDVLASPTTVLDSLLALAYYISAYVLCFLCGVSYYYRQPKLLTEAFTYRSPGASTFPPAQKTRRILRPLHRIRLAVQLAQARVMCQRSARSMAERDTLPQALKLLGTWLCRGSYILATWAWLQLSCSDYRVCWDLSGNLVIMHTHRFHQRRAHRHHTSSEHRSTAISTQFFKTRGFLALPAPPAHLLLTWSARPPFHTPTPSPTSLSLSQLPLSQLPLCRPASSPASTWSRLASPRRCQPRVPLLHSRICYTGKTFTCLADANAYLRRQEAKYQCLDMPMPQYFLLDFSPAADAGEAPASLRLCKSTNAPFVPSPCTLLRPSFLFAKAETTLGNQFPPSSPLIAAFSPSTSSATGGAQDKLQLRRTVSLASLTELAKSSHQFNMVRASTGAGLVIAERALPVMPPHLPVPPPAVVLEPAAPAHPPAAPAHPPQEPAAVAPLAGFQPDERMMSLYRHGLFDQEPYVPTPGNPADFDVIIAATTLRSRIAMDVSGHGLVPVSQCRNMMRWVEDRGGDPDAPLDQQQGSRLLQVGFALDLYLQFAKDKTDLTNNSVPCCLPLAVGDVTGRVGQIVTRKAVGVEDAEWTAKLAELKAANPHFLKTDDDCMEQPCDVMCMGFCQRHWNGQEALTDFDGKEGAPQLPVHEYGVFKGKDNRGQECHSPVCIQCLKKCLELGRCPQQNNLNSRVKPANMLKCLSEG